MALDQTLQQIQETHCLVLRLYIFVQNLMIILILLNSCSNHQNNIQNIYLTKYHNMFQDFLKLVQCRLHPHIQELNSVKNLYCHVVKHIFHPYQLYNSDFLFHHQNHIHAIHFSNYQIYYYMFFDLAYYILFHVHQEISYLAQNHSLLQNSVIAISVLLLNIHDHEMYHFQKILILCSFC